MERQGRIFVIGGSEELPDAGQRKVRLQSQDLSERRSGFVDSAQVRIADREKHMCIVLVRLVLKTALRCVHGLREPPRAGTARPHETRTTGCSGRFSGYPGVV